MLILEIVIGIILFIVGYILGRLNLLQRNLQRPNDLQRLDKTGRVSEWKVSSVKQHKPTRTINIDESKFVTDVSTDSFTSKHKSLGKKTVSQDSGIGASVSKLKNLKERK